MNETAFPLNSSIMVEINAEKKKSLPMLTVPFSTGGNMRQPRKTSLPLFSLPQYNSISCPCALFLSSYSSLFQLDSSISFFFLQSLSCSLSQTYFLYFLFFSLFPDIPILFFFSLALPSNTLSAFIVSFILFFSFGLTVCFSVLSYLPSPFEHRGKKYEKKS